MGGRVVSHFISIGRRFQNGAYTNSTQTPNGPGELAYHRVQPHRLHSQVWFTRTRQRTKLHQNFFSQTFTPSKFQIRHFKITPAINTHTLPRIKLGPTFLLSKRKKNPLLFAKYFQSVWGSATRCSKEKGQRSQRWFSEERESAGKDS